jgi:catechol 2,3-dioxygenase-like lactoylglutathione lyase family enzyme
MPEITSIVPVLKVVDLARSIDFYRNVLGFSVVWQAENDGGGENCMLVAGTINVLLSTGAHLGGQPQFTGTIYFTTRNVREFYGTVKDKAQIVWPLESMDYGQLEFGLRDPDGYVLAFAEPDADDRGGQEA